MLPREKERRKEEVDIITTLIGHTEISGTIFPRRPRSPTRGTHSRSVCCGKKGLFDIAAVAVLAAPQCVPGLYLGLKGLLPGPWFLFSTRNSSSIFLR